jgi:hypothetical protein
MRKRDPGEQRDMQVIISALEHCANTGSPGHIVTDYCLALTTHLRGLAGLNGGCVKNWIRA